MGPSPLAKKFRRQWFIAFCLWLLVLILLFAAFIWVEKAIWGTWPPPLKFNYLHLIRGILIATLTSVVAAAFAYRIRKSDFDKLKAQDRRLTLFLSAFDHSTDAILLTDLKGTILQVNNAFSRLFGYSREESIGQTTRILRSRYSTNEFYREMWRSINSKGEWKGEIINRTKDGNEIPIRLSITPVIHEGIKVGYMGIEIDMRERKELERRALEAERMAAVGRMSSQVAHEVRNPLSSISLNAELLRDELHSIQAHQDFKKVEEAKTLLKAIEKEVDRLDELAGDYLKFSRLPQHKRETTNLNELLTSLSEFLQEEARRRDIRMVLQPCKELPKISVDPKQLEQALLNLVKNAFEAMPKGGKVEVGILGEDQSAVLFVRDEGTGMDEETRRKIFDPFFTTKEKGTGLGLSLVRQVVAEHGGSVWCESVKEKGTTFFIRIPTSREGQLSQ